MKRQRCSCCGRKKYGIVAVSRGEAQPVVRQCRKCWEDMFRQPYPSRRNMRRIAAAR